MLTFILNYLNPDELGVYSVSDSQNHQRTWLVTATTLNAGRFFCFGTDYFDILGIETAILASFFLSFLEV